MSLRIVHETPRFCNDCGEPFKRDKDSSGNCFPCKECGTFAIVHSNDEVADEQETIELAASFVGCPHCGSLNEITVYGSEEVCLSCHLDPSRMDYTAEDLAHLWKEGGEIQGWMSQDRPWPSSHMFAFLTTHCGPHCEYGETCLQRTNDFTTCMSEEREAAGGSDEALHTENTKMGRGRKRRKENRKARKKRQRERQQKRIDQQNVEHRATLEYSGGGWYRTRMETIHETSHSEESSDTETRHGT